MSTYRLRIPALTTLWTYIDAESEDDAINELVKIINSTTVDYGDKRVWQVEKVEKGKVSDE